MYHRRFSIIFFFVFNFNISLSLLFCSGGNSQLEQPGYSVHFTPKEGERVASGKWFFVKEEPQGFACCVRFRDCNSSPERRRFQIPLYQSGPFIRWQNTEGRTGDKGEEVSFKLDAMPLRAKPRNF